MPPILGLLSSGGDVADVGAGGRLGDGEADALLAGQDLGQDLALQLRAGEVAERRRAHHQPDEQRRDGPAARQLIPQDQVVEAVPLLRFDPRYDPVLLPLFGDGLAARNGHQ